MRRYFDLTTREILALTDEQINDLIDLECAIEGKPLLPEYPPLPPQLKFEPDQTWYTIKELSSSILFHCPEAAVSVIDAILKSGAASKKYLPGSDYSAFRLNDIGQLSIEPMKVYSEERWSEQPEAHNAYLKAKEQYQSAKAAYDSAVKSRAEIAEEVTSHINRILNIEKRKNEIRQIYNRYLALSDNNRNIAMNFLENVEEVPKDLKAELLEEAA